MAKALTQVSVFTNESSCICGFYFFIRTNECEAVAAALGDQSGWKWLVMRGLVNVPLSGFQHAGAALWPSCGGAWDGLHPLTHIICESMLLLGFPSQRLVHRVRESGNYERCVCVCVCAHTLRWNIASAVHTGTFYCAWLSLSVHACVCECVCALPTQ